MTNFLRRSRRAWLIAWLPIAVAVRGLCQPERLDFEHIGPDQGLSHNTITGITQDRLGYMWFGTIDGLNRFDGYRCKVFRHDPDDPTSISSNFIHGFLEDPEGNLWIGTRDGGLSVLSPEGRAIGKFTRFLPDPDDPASLSHRTVHAFFRDSGGRLWVGTGIGLDLFRPETGDFIHYRIFGRGGGPLTVSGIQEDRNGRLWLATFDGLYRLDLKDLDRIDPETGSGLVAKYEHDPKDPHSLGDNLVNSLYLDRQGRLWVNARAEGIALFDRDRGGFEHFRHDPGDPHSLASNAAHIGLEDTEGLLWIGMDGGGLSIMDPKTRRFTQYRHQPSRSESLSHDRVSRIYQSRDGEHGTIWVGTWGGGINKVIDREKPFALVQHDPENPNSLSGNFVLALFEDRFGEVWVGADGGLNRWNRETGLWQRFLPDPADPHSIADTAIWQISEDRAGDMWLCTEEGGLLQLKRNKEADPVRFIHHRFEPGRPDSLPTDNIRFLFEDRNGTFWAGTEDKGLARQVPGQRQSGAWARIRHEPDRQDSLSDDAVRCMTQDAKGTLWVGTLNGGLNRCISSPAAPPGEMRFTHYRHNRHQPRSLGRNDVRHILAAKDGRLWVATFGGGLNLFNEDSRDFRNFTEKDGLANNFVYGILEDDRGNLWLSTNRGLSQFDPQREVFSNYGTQHGIQSDEFNTGAFHKNRRGELFFGGVNGINIFDPPGLMERLQRQETFRPQVVMTGFSNMGEPLPLDWSNPNQAGVTLAHDDKFFTFEFAVLDYRNPEKNRFRYRLEGFDEDWIANGTRHFASYTNLDPGHYRLRYQGANSSGIWQEGAPLEIRIAPPFWQTWWFRGLVLLGLLLAVAAGIQVKKYYRAYHGLKFVGHFKLLKKLGEGGSGTVYQARDKLSKRIVALKVLNSRMEETRDGIRRFLQEAEIGGRLNHPHIVTIHEAGNHGKARYICMEYLQGQTLKELIGTHGPLPQASIRNLARQILEGLAAIHRQGIVHRDLKSANIMVLEGERIKIMDFGLARISTLTTMENRDQLMGTLSYMSPEQTLGKAVDSRSDIYSLGVILYEMQFGRLPFRADNEMEMIYAIHNERPPGLDGKSGAREALFPIIARCLEKDPGHRYAKVAEVQAVLDRLELEAAV